MNQLKKKVAMIIAKKNFRDEEYFETKENLEKSGFNITTFSNKKGLAKGKLGGETFVNFDLDDLNVNNFDLLLFVGGSGALECLDNELSYKKINEAINQRRYVSAICIAPVILAHAGILKNIKATVWSSEEDESAIDILKASGAIYGAKKSIVDKNIVTADGPDSIKEFCLNIESIF